MGRQGHRGRRARRAVALLVPLALASPGCAGGPTSTSAWQSSTDRTIGTVTSGLGTARIAVREEAQDDIPHSYAVVTVTNAIETGSKEVAGYAVTQPPDRLHDAHATVIEALDDGVALLVDVRVALASPGLTPAAAKQLTRSIDAMRDRLDQLDSAVRTSPGSVATR